MVRFIQLDPDKERNWVSDGNGYENHRKNGLPDGWQRCAGGFQSDGCWPATNVYTGDKIPYSQLLD